LNEDLWQNRLTRLYVISIVFSCLGVAAQKFLKVNPGPIAPIMSAVIMLSGAGAVAVSIRNWRAVIGVVTIGTVSEIIGLFSGIPFGRYEYTDRWVPTVPLGAEHRFPLLLPLAWLMMVGGSSLFVRQYLTGWRLVVGTGALAAAIDIPMERAMTDVLGYWRWMPPGPLYGAPVLNTLGWFAVGCIAASMLPKASLQTSSAKTVLPLFCAFVAWNGLTTAFDLAWIVLLAFSIWLTTWGKKEIAIANDSEVLP
jgi:uncharacterized membrane protein